MIWFYEAVGSVRDFIELGGNVLWGIMFVLFLMWTFILERLWYFYRVHPSKKKAVILVAAQAPWAPCLAETTSSFLLVRIAWLALTQVAVFH